MDEPELVPIIMGDDEVRTSEQLRATCRRLLDECEKIIVGQRPVLEQLILAILSRGHCLLVGVPGLAKTLMIRTLADGMNLSFNRVQFTPDLMPTDITGTEILYDDKSTGQRGFRFVPGPLFANIVLADEINRTPPKTQAALLEAMQERQVTVGGVRHMLPNPFFVLATQNPIEQEGTYPLPEAQLDRFLLKVLIDYPAVAEERALVEHVTANRVGDALEVDDLKVLVSPATINALQTLTARVRVDAAVRDYAVDIVRATRQWGGIVIGAGPRGGIALVRAARARALLNGRDFVVPDDVKSVALPALRHRITLSPELDMEGLGADDVLRRVLASVVAPRA